MIKAVGEPQAPGAQSGDIRRLNEIRGVLGRFDWEFDDRQYALEAIENASVSSR